MTLSEYRRFFRDMWATITVSLMIGAMVWLGLCLGIKWGMGI